MDVGVFVLCFEEDFNGLMNRGIMMVIQGKSTGMLAR
jgi:hypothetical protein